MLNYTDQRYIEQRRLAMLTSKRPDITYSLFDDNKKNIYLRHILPMSAKKRYICTRI